MHKRGSQIQKWKRQDIVDLVHKLRSYNKRYVEPFPLVECVDESVRWNA